VNGRERELAAIRHEVPDRVPTDVMCVENGEAIAAALGIEPGAVMEALGIDGRIVGAAYTGPVPQATAEASGVTEWGTLNTGDYGTARRSYPLAGADSVAQVEAHAWPSPDRYDYAQAARTAQDLAGRYAVRGPGWHPLFCRVCDLMGMEEAMAAMIGRPAAFEAALERVFQVTAACCARLLDACGDAMPILYLGDDFATQRALMISPWHWRRFLKPRLARLFEIGKARGRLVWYHSCGDISAILEDLIEIGMDVWETVQLHTLPMSAAELKRQYGRHIAFFGGINTQRLPFWSTERVREEVRRCILALGEGGGYICGPDHHIKPDVPGENAIALFKAAREFRGAGYTLA